MKNIFTKYEGRADFSSAHFSDFLKKFKEGVVSWHDFIPLGDESECDSIIIEVNVTGASQPKRLRIGNSKLYMLKNEAVLNPHCGFSQTDIFNILKAIANEKPNWFNRLSDFMVYETSIDYSMEVVKVVSIYCETAEDAKQTLVEIKRIGDLVNKNSEIFHRWNSAFSNKSDKGLAIDVFGSYLKNILAMNANKNKTVYTGGEGKTPYHYFHQIANAESFERLEEDLQLYNINISLMLYGFEEFFYISQPSDFDFKKIDLSNNVLVRVSVG